MIELLPNFAKKFKVLTDSQYQFFPKKYLSGLSSPQPAPAACNLPHQARSHISSAFDELHVAAEARCAELLEHLQENSLLVVGPSEIVSGNQELQTFRLEG